MSNKQDLQKALKALNKAREEDMKATAKAIESVQSRGREQKELSSRQD